MNEPERNHKSHPLEVVYDVGWVSVVELGHRDINELHLLSLQHSDGLLQLLQVELRWQLHLHLKHRHDTFTHSFNSFNRHTGLTRTDL